MTSLDDLTDVDTTGRQDGDRLVYDDGLWVPKPAWEHVDTTFTYPTANGGWVLFEELDPVVDVDHVANVTAPPAAAEVYSFTVTSAMMDIGGNLDDMDALAGLHVVVAGTGATDTWRTLRMVVTVNGVAQPYVNHNINGTMLRWGMFYHVRCKADDELKVYTWLTFGSSTMKLEAVGARPAIVGLGAPTEEDGLLWLYRHVSQSQESVDTAPDGVDRSLYGTNIGASWFNLRSRRTSTNFISQTSANVGGPVVIKAGENLIATVYAHGTVRNSSNTQNSEGDILLPRLGRITAAELYKTSITPDPTL